MASECSLCADGLVHVQRELFLRQVERRVQCIWLPGNRRVRPRDDVQAGLAGVPLRGRMQVADGGRAVVAAPARPAGIVRRLRRSFLHGCIASYTYRCPSRTYCSTISSTLAYVAGHAVISGWGGNRRPVWLGKQSSGSSSAWYKPSALRLER